MLILYKVRQCGVMFVGGFYMKDQSGGMEKKAFFRKLREGDFGLAETYWLYGVVGGLLIRIFKVSVAVLLVYMNMPVAVSIVLAIIALVIIVFYMANVLLGVWRASFIYAGPKAWAVLARVAAVLGFISVAMFSVYPILSLGFEF